jgi:hypothetical protein
MKLVAILIIFTASIKTYASWLCREASSQAQSNHFYSCGVAEAKTLSQARKNSLSNAKEEFRAFCSESPNCRNKEYVITPMRTDCSKNENGFICYRGLGYKILDKDRDIKNINLEDLKEEIEIKEEHLKLLEEKHQNLKYLNQLNENIKDFDQMDKLEVELEDLQYVKANIKSVSNKAGFQFYYNKVPLPYGNQGLIGIGPEYERLFFGGYLGIRINTNYVVSTDSKPEINDRGRPNSTSTPEYHSHKGIDTNISIPIHIKNVSIGPKLGHTSLKYKSTTKSYNRFGVAQGNQVERHRFDDGHIGIGLRYENRFFMEVEPRKYIKANQTQIKFGFGISVGF